MNASLYRRVLSLICAAGISFSSLSALSEERIGTILANAVNLRKGASSSSEILCSLTYHSAVTILGTEGSFYKVRWRNVIGYVASEYVRDNDPVGHIGMVNADHVNLRSSAQQADNIIGQLKNFDEVDILAEENDFYMISTDDRTGYVYKDYITLSTAFSADRDQTGAASSSVIGLSASVITDTVNMRESASVSSGLMLTLTQGALVLITGIEDDFYKVSYNGKTGYIMSKYLSFTEGTSAAANPTEVPIVTTEKVSGYGIVTFDTVNMREAASTVSGLMYTLKRGTMVKINGIEGDFYKVSYNGKNGYIMTNYLEFTDGSVSAAAAVPAQTSGNGIVTSETVNMREAASTASGIMFTLQKGTVIRINGIDGDFYKVTYSGKTGYVMKYYLEFTDETVTSPSFTAVPTAAPSAVTGNVIVTADSLNVREHASTSAEILLTLAKGTIIKVTAADGDFYKITYQGMTGYVAKQFVEQTNLAVSTVKPTATPKPSTASSSAVNGWGKINASTVNLRKKASSSSDILLQLKSGEYVYIDGLTDGFYKVKVNGKTGYVASAYITVVSSTPAPTAKAAATAAPSASKYAHISSISGLGDAPGYLNVGDSGEDVEKLQQALKIKGYFSDTVTGYFGNLTQKALKEYQSKAGLTVTGKADYPTILKLFGKVSETTAADDPKMNGITSVSQITVPNTSQKGDSGSKVIALQQVLKLKGYFKAPIDGNFGTITQNAVLAFQKAYGIAQSGEADNTTIKALFGKNAANYTFTTESLDWFTKGDYTIPKRAVFTVKDCLTGYTFHCKRWSGSNHCDTEPLTAEDTAVLKRIYGGSWSWDRRAILVLYNGHVYAGSMNGMPHGTSTIENDFDGHFCIHFTGSMTHGSQLVDDDHQNAIKQALKYTW